TRSYGDWSSDVCSSDLSGLAQFVEGVEFFRLVEDLAVDAVDDAVPLPSLNRRHDGSVLAHRVLEFFEEHPINLHSLVPNGLFLRSEERRVGKECSFESS